MGTWLALEAVAAVLAGLLALVPGEPAPEPECERSAVEDECGELGGER